MNYDQHTKFLLKCIASCKTYEHLITTQQWLTRLYPKMQAPLVNKLNTMVKRQNDILYLDGLINKVTADLKKHVTAEAQITRAAVLGGREQ